MAYYEVKIGNSFKLDSKTDGYYTIDKSDYVLMISDIMQQKLFRELTSHQFSVLFTLSCIMDSKTNAVMYKNKPLNTKEISEMLDENYECFRRIVTDLLRKEVLLKSKLNNKNYYVVNPLYAFKGKSVSTELYELAQNTIWRNSEDLSTFLPQRGDNYYKEWMNQVLNRDNCSCVICGSKLNPEIHHIKPYAKYKTLRTDVNNGITLCELHHSSMVFGSFHHTYGNRNNTPEQLQEYIDNKRKELGLSMITIGEIVNK